MYWNDNENKNLPLQPNELFDSIILLLWYFFCRHNSLEIIFSYLLRHLDYRRNYYLRHRQRYNLCFRWNRYRVDQLSYQPCQMQYILRDCWYMVNLMFPVRGWVFQRFIKIKLIFSVLLNKLKSVENTMKFKIIWKTVQIMKLDYFQKYFDQL